MAVSNDPIQDFWDDLLSSEPKRIRMAFDGLDKAVQAAVKTHLQRMTEEEGWHPLQQESARTALQVIEKSDQIE